MNFKAWYTSKTLYFALLVAVFGVLQVNMPMFQAVMSPTIYGLVITFIGIVVAVLRVITTAGLAATAVKSTDNSEG